MEVVAMSGSPPSGGDPHPSTGGCGWGRFVTYLMSDKFMEILRMLVEFMEQDRITSPMTNIKSSNPFTCCWR
jgi:hypothetical protein